MAPLISWQPFDFAQGFQQAADSGQNTEGRGQTTEGRIPRDRREKAKARKGKGLERGFLWPFSPGAMCCAVSAIRIVSFQL